MSSRTSCAQRQATAILTAQRSASSRAGTSMIENPPMASGYRPSATVPSVPTTLAFSPSIPAPKTHTPASTASWTTACEALPTAGPSSSGMWSIAWASNEIRYRAIPCLPCPCGPLGRIHVTLDPTFLRGQNHRAGGRVGLTRGRS